MAVQTIYLLGTAGVTPNFWGNTQLNGTAPTTTNSAFGWAPAKAAVTTPYYRGRIGATTTLTSASAQAASYNASTSGPAKGTGTALTTASDSFVAGPFLGAFANTAWTFNCNMRASTAGCVGHINMRVWRSANADGTSATQVLANTVGATITLSATVDQNSSISFSPGALALNNEYLFFQIEWQETVAGTSNSDTVLFRIGSSTSITTPDFVPATLDAWSSFDKSANVTLSNIDKTATVTTALSGGARSTTKRTNGTAGKWYAEFVLVTPNSLRVGIHEASATITSAFQGTYYTASTGVIAVLGTAGSVDLGPAAVAGDVISMALDAGAERIWFRSNGGLWNADAAANPATGTNGIDISATPNTDHALWGQSSQISAVTIRTKFAEFGYAAPSGFKSWMNETPPTPDAWDLNALRGDAVLSNNDKTSTINTAAGAVRSTKRYLNGTDTNKLYVEFVNIGSGGTLVGTNGLSADTAADYLNSWTDAIHVQTANGFVSLGLTQLGTASIGAFTFGDVVCMAWDMQNKRVWFRKNGGNWNGDAAANPATNTNGADVSAAPNTYYYLWQRNGFSGSSGHGGTIRTTLADLGYAVPSGFTSWMGETPTPATDNAWNKYDKEAGVTLSNSDKLATGIGAARSTKIWSVGGSEKLYAELVVTAMPASPGFTLGVSSTANPLTNPFGSNNFCVTSSGLVIANGSVIGSGYPVLALGDVLGFAYDIAAQRGWIRLNNLNWNSDASANPATGTGGLVATGMTGSITLIRVANETTDGITIRTQVADFTKTAPAGFLSWMGETFGPVDCLGTLNLTQGAQTLSAAGTVDPINGDLALSQAAQTLAAQAKVVVGGTLTVIEADDTLAANATVANPTITATLAITQDAQTLSAQGGPVARGTLSVPQAAQTISAGGKVVVGATLSVPQAAQTLSAQGKIVVGGTLGVIEADNTLSAAANVSFPLITATLNVAQAAQTLVATGGPVVRGTLTAPQAAQTLSAQAGVTVGGALSLNQVAQTLAAQAGVTVSGTLGVVEIDDTLNAAANVGFPIITATLNVAQAAQTLVATGGPVVGGSLNQPQVSQTLAAVGTVSVGGTLNLPQANQTLVAAGGVTVRGQLSVPQAAQILAAQGAIVVGGALAVSQAAHTVVAAGTVRVSGQLNAIQADNSLAAAANVPVVGIGGSLSQIQADQTLGSVGTVSLSAALNQPQASQALAAQAGPIARGQLSAPQASQTLVAAGGPVARGQLSIPQASQTLVAAGGPVARGILTAPQASQTLSAAGNVAFAVISGSLNQLQASQILVAAGGILVRGQLSTPQAAQTLSAAGKIIVTGVLSRAQDAQTLVASGVIIGGLAKVWTGSDWVGKPAKVWMGSAWVKKPVKHWTGSEWRPT